MKLKNDKKDTRQIMTTNGNLAIVRTILRPADEASMSRLLETEQIRCIALLLESSKFSRNDYHKP